MTRIWPTLAVLALFAAAFGLQFWLGTWPGT